MSNYYIEANRTDPWENLAIEKCLADRVDEGDIILYLWQNDRTVVIGRNQNAMRECRVRLLEAEGGYLARRTTGGGAVYHDMGNLCFTFAASPEVYDLRRQMGVIQEACRAFGIGTQLSGRNDIITEEGFKFSGNAFSVTSRCNIQHGTIMVDVDIEQMKRYLTPSREKMKAKGVKSVQSRVCNLRDIDERVNVDLMKEALKKAFRDEYGEYVELTRYDLDEEELSETYELYSSRDWRFSRSPELETVFRKRFDWGEAEVWLKLKNLRIEECKVYSDALDVDFPLRLENHLLGKCFDELDETIVSSGNEEESQRIREVLIWLSSVC